MSNLSSSLLNENEGRQTFTGDFISNDKGEKIYFKTSKSSQEKAHIILLHDVGEYSSRFVNLFHFLESKEEITVSYLDFVGHGLSNGTRGHVEDFDQYCEDLGFFVNYLQTENQKTPIVLLGSGLGAVVAVKLHQMFFHLLLEPIKGFVLANPALKLKWDIPNWLKSFTYQIEGTLGKIKLPYRLEGHELTKDEAMAEEYNGDPLINHSITLSLYKELSHSGKIVRTSSYFLDVPTLTLISGDDIFYEQRSTRLFEKGIGKSLSNLIEYPDAKHDLFNEICREKVFGDVYNWLNQHFLEN